MRTSIGSFGVVYQLSLNNLDELLLQWNDHWKSLNLVGGHKLPEETFRECCVREVAEELGLIERRSFTVADYPMARLQYVAYSKRARVETDYTIEVFRVTLIGNQTLEKVSFDHRNEWVTRHDIQAGKTKSNRPISDTVTRVFAILDENAGAEGCSRSS